MGDDGFQVVKRNKRQKGKHHNVKNVQKIVSDQAFLTSRSIDEIKSLIGRKRIELDVHVEFILAIINETLVYKEGQMKSAFDKLHLGAPETRPDCATKQEPCRTVEIKPQDLSPPNLETTMNPDDILKAELEEEMTICTNISQKDHPRQIESIVCYGIGNVAESVIAGYQMALLCALRQELQVPAQKCFVFDPVLCEREKEAITQLGFSMIEHNEKCKRRVDKLTLFFMPHCGKAMYNNLLYANWCDVTMSNVLLLGNSFSTILNNTPSRILQEEAAYIQRIAPYTDERPIPNTFKYEDIFNNTSLHAFHRCNLPPATDVLWVHEEEPRYEHNCEIIQNS